MKILVIGDSMIKYLKEYLSDEKLDVVSYPGATIDRITSKVSMIERKYDCFLVHVGTNNIQLDSVEVILQKYKLLIKEILQINPKAKVICSSLIPRGINYFQKDFWTTKDDIEILNHKIDSINNELKSLCSDHEALVFCSSSKSTWYGFLGYDGLHLNRRGNHHLSDLFYDVLKSFISLENASKKIKMCHSVVPDLLDSTEFPPLSCSEQPPLLPSSLKHTFVTKRYPSSQWIAAQSPASACPVLLPASTSCQVSHSVSSLPVASLVPPSLPVASSIPPSLPVASSIPPSLPVASSVPPSLPVASSLPPSLPVASSLPPSLPVAS
ncbi:unnamed protein product, partial [Larinioides sclopetarius]